MNLHLLPDVLAICSRPPAEAVPAWALAAPGFASITRTADELSIVCAAAAIPAELAAVGPWRALQVAGPLDFALTGIVACLAAPLAEAGISIFPLATYQTDFILVRADRLADACAALERAGHTVTRPGAAGVLNAGG